MNVGCLKINEDKSSKSRVQTPDAGLIKAITAIPRREGQNPRPRITAAPRCEGQNPRLSISVLLQQHGARLKSRVSVITVLITGSLTAHVVRELTPIMEHF